MMYRNKEFIEAVDNREQEFYYRVFTVVYEDRNKPSEGLWMIDPRSFMGCLHKTTINLDNEDLEYLYNKYKSKAIEEIEAEKVDDEKRRQEKIKETEEKLRKLKEDPKRNR